LALTAAPDTVVVQPDTVSATASTPASSARALRRAMSLLTDVADTAP
jgi:hypothetical protein